MSGFSYKGYLISVRRLENGGGWLATASVERAATAGQVAFRAVAPRVGALVRRIEESIREHRAQPSPR